MEIPSSSSSRRANSRDRRRSVFLVLRTVLARLRLGHICPGVLLVETPELFVQLRMPSLQCMRILEERFGDHREKLGGVLRAVLVDDRWRPLFLGGAQCFELLAHHPGPREILGVRVERRRSVRAVVLEVELVRELV